MSQSNDENLLNRILKEIINSTPGIKHAIIIDDTGITLLSQSKFATLDEVSSVEKIGAIGGAVFIAGEEQGHVLEYGDIGIQITEYQKGVLFSQKIGRGILCLATDTNVQIGYVKAILKKWSPKLNQILSRYLQTDQEGINKELKELFNTDELGY